MVKRGLIISSEDYLGNINIKNIEFVILRIGFTDYNLKKTKHKDICFDEYFKWANSNNLKVGILYISRATSLKEANDEISYIFDIVKNIKFDYPIMISMKDNHNTKIFYSENHKTIKKSLYNEIVRYIYNRLIDCEYIPIILTNKLFFNKDLNNKNYNILLEEEIDRNMFYLDIQNLSKDKINKYNKLKKYKIIRIIKNIILKVRKK